GDGEKQAEEHDQHDARCVGVEDLFVTPIVDSEPATLHATSPALLRTACSRPRKECPIRRPQSLYPLDLGLSKEPIGAEQQDHYQPREWRDLLDPAAEDRIQIPS